MDQTARAMTRAPLNAIYVVAGYGIEHKMQGKQVAQSLNRYDLHVHTSAIFDDDGARLRGLRVPIVIDPGLMLCESHRAVYQRHLAENGAVHRSEWDGAGGAG